MIITLPEESNAISSSDLAALADWASKQKQMVVDPESKKVYSMFREASDLLLRQRARTIKEKGERQ